VFALLITGPPGAGKTEVLAALSDLLVADDVRHATVEVEALTSAHPALSDDQWSEPVRAVCALYRRFGYERLLATATVEGQDDLDRVGAAIGADELAVVRLEAAPATLRRRIVEREPDGWPGLDGLLAAADRLAPVIAGLDGIALALGTDGERPPAVAGRIRAAFSGKL
jgi:broad-specificity NMP kinase